MNWKSPALRLGLVLLLVVMGGVGFVTWRELERSARIQSEINALQKEADMIGRENDDLTQKIQYFASPDFQEQEAKEKLGLRRLEEDVVMIQGTPSLSPTDESTMDTNGQITKTDGTLPNYRKWWKLFFN